jgi:hypothetical protein
MDAMSISRDIASRSTTTEAFVVEEGHFLVCSR